MERCGAARAELGHWSESGESLSPGYHPPGCVNPCLMRAMLLGHVVLPLGEDARQVLLLDSMCYCCRKPLACTVGDALYQNAYGGNEEGAAAVRCKNCTASNFVTGLCSGQPTFSRGKFHQHCTECPDFGICIGDCRTAHCDGCGSHYFPGTRRPLPCGDCGGGEGRRRKSQRLSELEGSPFPSNGA